MNLGEHDFIKILITILIKIFLTTDIKETSYNMLVHIIDLSHQRRLQEKLGAI